MTITDKLADALRTIDEHCQTGLNSSVYSHWSAALEDAMRVSREALAAYDAQQAPPAGLWAHWTDGERDYIGPAAGGEFIAEFPKNSEHAARIVQCVNAHDTLVSALRRAFNESEDVPAGLDPNGNGWWSAAYRALKAVEPTNA